MSDNGNLETGPLPINQDLSNSVGATAKAGRLSISTIVGVLRKILGLQHTSNVLTLIFGLISTIGVVASILIGLGYWKGVSSSTSGNQSVQSSSSAAGGLDMLREASLPFTVEGFKSAIIRERTEVVDWYISAGMSANEKIEGRFPIWFSRFNSGRQTQLIDLFVRHGVNFKLINYDVVATNLNMHVSVGVDLLDDALEDGHLAVAEQLIKIGADSESIIPAYATYCKNLRDNSLFIQQLFGKVAFVQEGNYWQQLQLNKSAMQLLNSKIVVLKSLGVTAQICKIQDEVFEYPKSSLTYRYSHSNQ